MRDREKYLAMTRFDPNLGGKSADNKHIIDEPQLFLDFYDAKEKLTHNFRTKRLESSIRWLLGFERYVKDKETAVKRKYRNYSKGSIVYVDFFGNYGSEMTYDHPAIVLKEQGGLLIVAPLTSNSRKFRDNNKYHIKLSRNTTNLGNQSKDSTILLEQIRCISKNRVLRKFGGRVSNNEILERIDTVVMEYIGGFTYNKWKANLEEQEAIIREKETEIRILSERISKLEERS
ncbi:type II toxin-antitoxin system PemK/MazF family toxin [Listeria weihenstephanensis]|uniref:Type II toxin-antitoxin system PemK/MazF family toxin n=1 Tax=Listeria weihenstephanensis TaxID=1006155 RepID=A0A841Z6K8_9LIST|nr:type II toxin-antitoxin system PemK/MazF family toxin [Listeria weihenstephanensis]MBC1500874.1 type II toxin-antitoxin system PemK/MazF family toxin [Listeria weihenstephanensis]